MRQQDFAGGDQPDDLILELNHRRDQAISRRGLIQRRCITRVERYRDDIGDAIDAEPRDLIPRLERVVTQMTLNSKIEIPPGDPDYRLSAHHRFDPNARKELQRRVACPLRCASVALLWQQSTAALCRHPGPANERPR